MFACKLFLIAFLHLEFYGNQSQLFHWSVKLCKYLLLSWVCVQSIISGLNMFLALWETISLTVSRSRRLSMAFFPDASIFCTCKIMFNKESFFFVESTLATRCTQHVFTWVPNLVLVPDYSEPSYF